MAALVFAPAMAVTAQPLGTFRWQLAPHCNVLTLRVDQVGSHYTLSGTDDLCGAAASASAQGTAHAPPANVIPRNGTPTANCPGTFASPRAQPGHLCLYEGWQLNVAQRLPADSLESGGSVDTTGGIIFTRSTAAGEVQYFGKWVVTMP
jgi:hypothetical protein